MTDRADGATSAEQLFHSSAGTPPDKPLQAGLIGLVLGIDAIGHCVALATLCFAGTLVGGLSIATATFLASTALVTLVLVRMSAFRNAIGIAQDTSIAILAPAAAIAASQAVGGDEARIATALAVIGMAALLSGLAFLVVGSLGLGRLLRLVPYPVASGFLASSGYLLVLAALMILTEASSLTGVLSHLGQSQVWFSVVPAIALAGMLILLVRLGFGSVAVLTLVLGAIALFYGALSATGTDIAQARVLGLLPPVPAGDAAHPGLLDLAAQIDWRAVLASLPVLAAVVLINLMGLLLNISGVELAAQKDIDVNQELRVTGCINMVVGAFGGTTGYMTSGSTSVAERLGIRSRALGLSYSAVALAGCIFAAPIVASVPVFVAAGLLMFIGSSMLEDWLLATRHKLILADWLIVLGIVALTVVFGILPAIGLGLGLAVLAFAIGYARLPVIRSASDATRRRSTLDRPPHENAILSQQGARVRILHLQGYLFFGSVEKLIDKLRSELAQTQSDKGSGAALVMDFSAVTGLDSAGCAAIGKLGYVAKAQDVAVHLVALPETVLATLRRWDLEVSGTSGIRLWANLDSALEACENSLIDIAPGDRPEVTMLGLLETLGDRHHRTADLLAMMEPVALAQGDRLIQHGVQSGDVYFLETGRLAAIITGPLGQRLRVSSMAPGAVVGEVARYRERLRSADVVAELPSRVYCLSENVFARIEQGDRDLAALVHAILARSLSDKLVQANRSAQNV